MSISLPRLLEPAELAAAGLPTAAPLLHIHVGDSRRYRSGHPPGAVHLGPAELVAGRPPIPGAMPDPQQLSACFSRLGLRPESHVIASDDEGGGWAGRLVWTLEMMGFRNWSYLNGGSIAWQQSGLPLHPGEETPTPSNWKVAIDPAAAADLQELLTRLSDPQLLLWDARSEAEYRGLRSGSKRAGHIPGAVHCEWLDLMDREHGLRLRDSHTLTDELAALGITPDKDVVCYCQSHHRSALCYMVGRLLGIRIRGYPGSWAEWGNRDDTPIET